MTFIADTVYLGENFELVVTGVQGNGGLYKCTDDGLSLQRAARLIYYGKV